MCERRRPHSALTGGKDDMTLALRQRVSRPSDIVSRHSKCIYTTLRYSFAQREQTPEVFIKGAGV